MFHIIQKAYAITADQIGSTFLDLPTTTFGSVSSFLTVVISWILYFAGILAFIFLVYSGILYITSGGSADQQKKAQSGLISAIIGIVIITLSYAILRAVNNLASGGSI